MQVFRVRIVLRMTDTARMHAHHAAILYSLLSHAYGVARKSEPCIPDGVLLDAPEQARLWLAKDSPYAFGFTLLAAAPLEAGRLTDLLITGLRKAGRRTGAPKVALGGNFEVQLVQDLIAGETHRPGHALEPLSPDFIADEVDRATRLSTLTLDFQSPLRAHRPKKLRADGHQYFDRFCFTPSPLLQRIAARTQALGIAPETPFDLSKPPRVIDNRLVWLDLSYGPRQTRKALGGAMGTVTLGDISPEVAACFALGQHVRIGEATRFGFGNFRIAELGSAPFVCPRAVDLLTLATEHPSLDEAAVKWELPAGEAREAAQQLSERSYQPHPHFRVEIPKPDGSRRTLAIPSRLDRVLQRAVLDVASPALDLFLEESSIAYRRGLGRHTAAQRLKTAYGEGFRWGLKADFFSFFDSVLHTALRERLRAYLADAALVDAIMRWVESGAPYTDRGIPTGAPLSPLLANLFLDEFDEAVSRDDRRLIRYADDFVVLFRDRADADRVLSATRQAAEALQLALNDDKTNTVELRTGFDFLGYRFESRDSWRLSGPEGPTRLEELGWKERRRGTEGSEQNRLNGESDLALPLPGTLIAGPNLEEMLLHGDKLQFKYRDRNRVESVALASISELVVIGAVALPRAVVELLQRQSLAVLFVDELGRALSEIDPFDAEADVAGVTGLVDASRNEGLQLNFARQLISAKLHNYAALAEAYRKPDYAFECEKTLRRLSRDALHAENIDILLGLEGSGAAAWYGSMGPRLPAGFVWTQRVAPAADDPVNILLNLAFMVLHRLVRRSLRQVKLVDSIGLLHRPRPGHAALASDLQEPFRHLMDRAVLETLRRIRPEDFEPDEKGPFPVRIKPRALREALAWIHRILGKSCAGERQSEPIPYRLQIARQSRSLRKLLIQPDARFEPFRHP